MLTNYKKVFALYGPPSPENLHSEFLTKRGGSRISGKGVHIYKGLGVRFADFISFFLKYSMIEAKFFHFHGILKTGGGGGGMFIC